MHIKSILVLTDFSVGAEHAVERAAMIAKQHQAALKLMYFSETDDCHPEEPFTRLRQRARQLAGRHDLSVRAVARTTATLRDVAAKARSADLVVLDPRSRHVLGRLLRGSLHARLMRRCRCPVLVVKGESDVPYAQVLVAVDFSADWRALVGYARSFESAALLEVRGLGRTPDDRAGTTAPLPEFPGQAMAALLAPLAGAWRRLSSAFFRISDDFLAAERIGAGELLIVGKSVRPAWVEILCGSIADRFARQARCDVLVVPASHAPQRVELLQVTRAPVAGSSSDGTLPPLTLRGGGA